MSKEEYLEVYKKIGQNIRKYRKEKDISQEELAFMISSARNYIGCIERAEKFPSIAVIYKISNSLGVSLESLFKNI